MASLGEKDSDFHLWGAMGGRVLPCKDGVELKLRFRKAVAAAG